MQWRVYAIYVPSVFLFPWLCEANISNLCFLKHSQPSPHPVLMCLPLKDFLFTSWCRGNCVRYGRERQKSECSSNEREEPQRCSTVCGVWGTIGNSWFSDAMCKHLGVPKYRLVLRLPYLGFLLSLQLLEWCSTSEWRRLFLLHCNHFIKSSGRSTCARLQTHGDKWSSLQCLLSCLHTMAGACRVYAGMHTQKYVDHIPLINIHHGNIGSSESFRTLILQRGELGGCFERALVPY